MAWMVHSVHEPQHRTQPPGRPSQQRENGGVAQRETLADAEMNDKAGHARTIGILGHDGTQDQGEVHASQAGQLCRHHDGREDGRGNEAE
jgi:hypothetical protein